MLYVLFWFNHDKAWREFGFVNESYLKDDCGKTTEEVKEIYQQNYKGGHPHEGIFLFL